jgi:hypothetical protein
MFAQGNSGATPPRRLRDSGRKRDEKPNGTAIRTVKSAVKSPATIVFATT